jgi:hypothetical protein
MGVSPVVLTLRVSVVGGTSDAENGFAFFVTNFLSDEVIQSSFLAERSDGRESSARLVDDALSSLRQFDAGSPNGLAGSSVRG